MLNVCSTFSDHQEEHCLARGPALAVVVVAVDALACVHVHRCGVQVLFLMHKEDPIEVFEDKVSVLWEVPGGAGLLG